MSGSTDMLLELTMERERPPKSPTLTPLNAMTGAPAPSSPAALKFSACRPHSVRRTDMPVMSTSVNSRFVICKARCPVAEAVSVKPLAELSCDFPRGSP